MVVFGDWMATVTVFVFLINGLYIFVPYSLYQRERSVADVYLHTVGTVQHTSEPASRKLS